MSVTTVGQFAVLLTLGATISCNPRYSEEEAEILAIVDAVRDRNEVTGVYEYSEEEIQKLERILERHPENAEALHIVAWAYSTYDRYRNDILLHERALIYAQKALETRSGDEFLYGVLGAAFYIMGN